MAESTVDTLKNRGGQVMAQVDAAVKANPAVEGVSRGDAVAQQQGPPPERTRDVPGVGIVRGTTNPDSRLPDTEGVFHKIVRRFKGEGAQ